MTTHTYQTFHPGDRVIVSRLVAWDITDLMGEEGVVIGRPEGTRTLITVRFDTGCRLLPDRCLALLPGQREGETTS